MRSLLILSLDYCARMSGNNAIKLSIVPRLLTRQQAAAYCGVSVPTFVGVCPIKAVALGSSKRLERFGRRANAHDDRRRSQTSRSRDRPHRRAAYLGSEPRSPSSCPLYRSGRWHLARRRTLDFMPARFLSTGAGALASLSQAVSRRPHRALRCRPTTILQRSRRVLGSRGVRVPSRAASQARMGGLCQAPFRWPRTGAGLSGPLYPPRRHRQRPAHQTHR